MRIRIIAVVLVMLVLFAAAAFTGSGLIFAAIILIAVLILFGIITNRIASKKVTAQMMMVDNSAGRDENIILEVTLKNESVFPIFKGRVDFKTVNTNFGFETNGKMNFSIRGKDSIVVRTFINSDYCGRYSVVLDSVRCFDPWGLTWVTVLREYEDYGYMFPGMYAIGSVSEAIKTNYEKERKFAGRKNPNLSEILQYREYEKGDSLKNVNWKLSVKHDKLLVREFDTPIDNQLLVILDINDGSADYQNLTYSAMFSICASYLNYNLPHQICWPEGTLLRVGTVETLDDLFREVRTLLSSKLTTDMSAVDIMISQGGFEKYAKIIYITNSINPHIEFNLDLLGNCEIVCVDEKRFSMKNFAAEMKHLAV